MSERRAGRLRRPQLWILAAVAAYLSACVALREPVLSAPPTIAGADFVGNAACRDCHQAITSLFPESPHGRFYRAATPAETGCESCHGPASKHVKDPTAFGSIVNPGKSADACSRCHVATRTEFDLPHHHPVPDGQMSCASCHDPHGRSVSKAAGIGALGHHTGESCASCHLAQATGHAFEHEALREGCLACHVPHGGVHRRLLRTPDNNLCLRCHAQVAAGGIATGELYIGKRAHTFDVTNTNCWTSGCHTAVHGSNANPKLLY